MIARQRWVGLVVLALTFVAGGIAGYAIRQVTAVEKPTATRDSGENRDNDRRSRRFPYELLNVGPEQRAQIEAVFERRRAEMAAVWGEYEPRMDAIVDSTRAEVDQLLTPEQRQAYEEYRKKRREQRSSERGDNDRDRRP